MYIQYITLHKYIHPFIHPSIHPSIHPCIYFVILSFCLLAFAGSYLLYSIITVDFLSLQLEDIKIAGWRHCVLFGWSWHLHAPARRCCERLVWPGRLPRISTCCGQRGCEKPRQHIELEMTWEVLCNQSSEEVWCLLMRQCTVQYCAILCINIGCLSG
jgi:hypothetical protein